MAAASHEPLNLCIAAIGGYARVHHSVASELEGEGALRLLATCDPRADELRSVVDEFAFQQRGVAVLKDFHEMVGRYSRHSHLFSIATPIHLHAAMHAAVSTCNIGCYLEKPPTLDPRELDTMIAIEQASDFQTEVGFNYMAEAWRRDFKRRILEGEWGELLALSLYGAWTRDLAYYQRSRWAGKLMTDENMVLDSCFGNANSHNVHNLLFFAGRDGVFSWAEPGEVRCELYRAYPIEGADTVFSEMTTRDGVVMRVALSHACESVRDQVEVLHCERAEIRIYPFQRVEILHRSGRREVLETDANARMFRDHFLHYLGYLRGFQERPLTGLADCRPFVIWNALNYLAARQIQSIPSGACKSEAATRSIFVTGIEGIMGNFIRTGAFPSEQGVAWSCRGDLALPESIPTLESCILELVEREKKAA